MTIHPTKTITLPLPDRAYPTDPRWPIALTFSDKYFSYEEALGAGAGRVYDIVTDMGKTSRAGFLRVDQEVTIQFNALTEQVITVYPGWPMAWDSFYVQRIYLNNLLAVNIWLYVTG